MNSFKFLKRTLSMAFVITLATFMACHKHTEQPAVNVSGFTPTQGNVGDAITISGNNFSANANNNVVDFNGTNATVTSATTTSLVVTVPQGATSGKVSVVVDKSKGTSSNDFTVLMPPAITSFSPASGAVAVVVTITGTNFSTTAASNVVKFNGTAATVSAATTTSLTVAVPASATTGKITVTVNGVTVTSATDFTVNTSAGQQPTLTGFSPANGLVGSSVTISGTNFSTTAASNIVKFNGTAATISNATATSLAVTVPPGATAGKITVTVNGATATSANDFIVSPAIASLNPASGSVGTSVVITGTNFDATATNNTVKFNGTPATVIQASADGTSLTVTVPPGATTGAITVTVNGITATSAAFTVNASNLRWRVKEIDTNGVKTNEYVYDNNNVLTQIKIYSPDQNNQLVVGQTINFSYNADGTLSSTQNGGFPFDDNTNVYTIYDYQYTNGVCEGSTLSNESHGNKTLKYTTTFTYQNGFLSKQTTVDATTNTSFSIDFTYSTVNGDRQTVYHYPAFTNTYTYYSNLMDPHPESNITPGSDDYHLAKSLDNGASANFSYNVTYTINADGNIGTVTYDYPNKATYNYSLTYIYETY